MLVLADSHLLESGDAYRRKFAIYFVLATSVLGVLLAFLISQKLSPRQGVEPLVSIQLADAAHHESTSESQSATLVENAVVRLNETVTRYGAQILDMHVYSTQTSEIVAKRLAFRLQGNYPTLKEVLSEILARHSELAVASVHWRRSDSGGSELDLQLAWLRLPRSVSASAVRGGS